MITNVPKKASSVSTVADCQALRTQIASMCTSLHMSGLKARFNEVCQDPKWLQMSTDQQLYDLLSCEMQKRQSNVITRLHRHSNLPTELQYVHFSDIYENVGRQWNDKLLSLIKTGEWMMRERPDDLVISGACGSGKSFVAACCANYAIEHKMSVYFVRSATLFEDLAMHRRNGTIAKRKKELSRIGLLILDDFLIEDMSESNTSDLLDLINDRYHRRSTIFTSQFRLLGWMERLGETPLTQAVIDRIRHSAYQLHIEAPETFREEKEV
jgi:DNA replication protein DnaC